MLREQLTDAMKMAMKEKKQVKLSTLRLILAAIKHRDIESRSSADDGNGISDQEITLLLQSMIKQRLDAIKLAQQAGRDDIADKEAAEIKIIQEFLPKQMTETEIGVAIDDIIKTLEASSLKDMGAVMALLKEKYAGKMDFSMASKLVKDKLS